MKKCCLKTALRILRKLREIQHNSYEVEEIKKLLKETK